MIPNRLSFFPLIFVFPFLAGFVQAQNIDPERDFTLRTSSELVVLDVAVKNQHGENVSGLSQENFHVFEDGMPQEIKQFSAGDLPVTIGLVVDASGSMLPKYAQAVAGASSLIRTSNRQDQIFIVNFNDYAWLGLPPEQPFSDNINTLEAALRRRNPEGKTALYDALKMGLNQLSRGMWERKAILLISDGGDNQSTSSLNDVIHLVQTSRATIYTIGLFDLDDPDRNPRVLKELAHLSGGEYFRPEEISGLNEICLRIASDIRNRYTLAYTPDRTVSKRNVRSVRVVVSSPDGKKLSVRTRASYSLPDLQ